MLNSFSHKQRNGLVGGTVLILLGLFLFATQFLQFENSGLIILGGLSILFLLWGILARAPGFLIPGGILGGLAIGIALSQLPAIKSSSEHEGAVILMGLGAGFISIPLLTYLVVQRWSVWGIFVGALFVLIGGALWIGGAALNLLNLLSQAWPLVLVLIGASILWRVWRRSAMPDNEAK